MKPLEVYNLVFIPTGWWFQILYRHGKDKASIMKVPDEQTFILINQTLIMQAACLAINK